MSDRAYIERGSFVQGAPARRGKRAGTLAPQAGDVGSDWRKRLPSRSTAPTDNQPWKRAVYTEEIRRGPDGGVTPGTVHEAYGDGWRHQRTGWYYIETQPAHQAKFNRAIRMNCQPASPLQREGCPDGEVTRGRRCRAPSVGVEYNGSTCGGTTRICIEGDDAGSMCARTVRRTSLSLIPPFWTGEIIFRTRITPA